MSYNPVRAAQPYRNTSKRRRRVDPKAGIKHSDIMRRQGVGQSVPLAGRTRTSHGVGAPIFDGDKFIVRSEVVFAGNSTDYGVNDKADRVYQVTSGVLYATVKTGENKDGSPIRENVAVQAGGTFRAPKGVSYCVSTATSDAEILIIEDKGYEKNWTKIEEGTVSEAKNTATLAGETSDAPTQKRRKNQDKAKAAALANAKKRGRSTSPNVNKRVGVNKTTSSNAPNVSGTNPMPAGAAAYKDD